MSWAKDRHKTGQYNSLVGTVKDWISLGSCSNQLLFGGRNGSPVYPLASAVLFHFVHLVTRSNNPNRGKQTSPVQPDLWYTGGTNQYCCSECLEKYLQGWTTIMISIQEYCRTMRKESVVVGTFNAAVPTCFRYTEYNIYQLPPTSNLTLTVQYENASCTCRNKQSSQTFYQ